MCRNSLTHEIARLRQDEQPDAHVLAKSLYLSSRALVSSVPMGGQRGKYGSYVYRQTVPRRVEAFQPIQAMQSFEHVFGRRLADLSVLRYHLGISPQSEGRVSKTQPEFVCQEPHI